MIFTLEEAKEILRVYSDDDNKIIQDLIDTLPQYLFEKTGKRWDTEPIEPLVKTVSRFLLASWYDMDSKNYDELIKYNLALLCTRAIGGDNEN